MRDSFVFYRSFYEALLGMDKENQADCLMAVADYALNGKEPTMTPTVRMFFTLVRPQIDANNQKFENGKKGGRPRNQTETETKPKNNQEETKAKPNVNVNGNVNEKEKDTLKGIKKEKISFSDVDDWESLFTYWEENKKGGRYKNVESRQRMLDRLKELTGHNLEFAKQAICHCIDNGYQGFSNGNELFYKTQKIPIKTIETKPDAFEVFHQAMSEIRRRATQ